jgi:hypothetical protein
MKPLLHFQRRGWVLLVLFPFTPAPSVEVPAPVGLHVVLAYPHKIHSLADSVEVVLHNTGPNVLHVLASTDLLTKSSRSRRPVFLALNVSQTAAMSQHLVTPPCLRLAPASYTRVHWPVRQVVGYSYSPTRLVALAGGPILRIQFTFEQCSQKTPYTPSWTLQVRL